MEEKYFHKKSSEKNTFVRKRKWSGSTKMEYKLFFSVETWWRLSDEEKITHSLNDCHGCTEKYGTMQRKFPEALGHRTKKQPLQNITNITPENQNILELNTSIEIPKSKNISCMKVVAKTVLEDIDKSWNALYDTPFTKVLPKVKTLNLTPRRNKIEKQKHLRETHRNIKKKIENAWQENGRDSDTLYGTRQSGSSYMKQRACLNFEAKTNAIARSSGNNLNK